MASPVINYDPRMERIGYLYPPACGFMPAAGIYGFAPGALRHTPIPVPFSFAPPGLVLAIVRSTVTVWHKRKTPNGFGGLDPWRWAILESVRKPNGKNTHSDTTQAHQKHRGLYPLDFPIPTVATPLTMPILPESLVKCQPPP